MSQSDPSISTPVLPATLRLGAVHLTVSNLNRSISFYERCVGLRTHRRTDDVVFLGAGKEDLFVLVEDPDARRARDHVGIAHVGLLCPTRIEFARAVLRAALTRALVERSSDDSFSEAIYLVDPDGIGVEVYHDRPRASWPARDEDGVYAPSPSTPLNLPAVMKDVTDPGLRRQAEPGLSIGHVRLYVGEMDLALAFYRDLLGFELTSPATGVINLSAGGYHHHLALDPARGADALPPPERSIGLRHWTIVLEDDAQVGAIFDRLQAIGLDYEVRGGGLFIPDPWGLAVAIRSG